MTENTNAKKKRNFKPKVKKNVSKENLGKGTKIGAKKNETKKAPQKAPKKVVSKKETSNEAVVDLKQNENDFSFKKSNLKIIPLGGIEEIGKNITVFEYENDIIVVDCGVAFPEDDMLGIDLVIPDFSYLVKNQDRIKGVVITHGHEDHIGSLPYLLKEINVPIYDHLNS